jgi:hypothetical protein
MIMSHRMKVGSFCCCVVILLLVVSGCGAGGGSGEGNRGRPMRGRRRAPSIYPTVGASTYSALGRALLPSSSSRERIPPEAP